MNTINNPLILTQEYINRDDGSGDYYYFPNKDAGVNLQVVDLELAEEMLEALEDYRDFLITGVSAIPTDDIIDLILKAKRQ